MIARTYSNVQSTDWCKIGAKGILGRGFPDGLAAETASHYSGEFRSPISRWGLSGKLRPTLERQNGMDFPVEASSGKPIPESALGTGRDFPNGPLAETASRNRHSDWDVFSRSSPSGKLRPGICARNGTQFPQGPNQPPAPRQNHPLSSVVCGTSKECPRVPAQWERPQLPAALRRNCKNRTGNRSHLRGFSGRSQRYVTEAHVSYGLPNGTGTRCLSRLTKQ